MLLSFKDYLDEQNKIKKKKVTNKRGFRVYSISMDNGLEIVLRFAKHALDLDLKNYTIINEDISIGVITFKYQDSHTKNDDITSDEGKNASLKLLQLFKFILKDSEIKREFNESDLVHFNGKGKWRHQTYKKFAEQLAKHLGAYKTIKRNYENDILSFYIIKNKNILRKEKI